MFTFVPICTTKLFEKFPMDTILTLAGLIKPNIYIG